jgi:hypothetical protein
METLHESCVFLYPIFFLCPFQKLIFIISKIQLQSQFPNLYTLASLLYLYNTPVIFRAKLSFLSVVSCCVIRVVVVNSIKTFLFLFVFGHRTFNQIFDIYLHLELPFNPLQTFVVVVDCLCMFYFS